MISHVDPRLGRRKLFDQARKHFRSFSRDEYPTIVALADDLADDDPDALFQFGVDVWLNGLEKKLTARRA